MVKEIIVDLVSSDAELTCARIPLSYELAQAIMSRRNVVAQHQLFETAEYRADASFYRADVDQERLPFPDGEEPAEAHVDSMMLRVRTGGFVFSCYEKYTGIPVSTEIIPFEVLEGTPSV